MRNRMIENWIMNNTQEGQDIANGLDQDAYNNLSEDDQWRYVEGLDVDFENVEPTDKMYEEIKEAAENIAKAIERKSTPVFSGFLAYFADAVNAVARCSFAGQQQHAPDEPLQWHRDKSGDELDALSRHLLEAGTIDDDGIRHSSKVAWRAMANLQKELELAGEAPLSKYNKI